MNIDDDDEFNGDDLFQDPENLRHLVELSSQPLPASVPPSRDDAAHYSRLGEVANLRDQIRVLEENARRASEDGQRRIEQQMMQAMEREATFKREINDLRSQLQMHEPDRVFPKRELGGGADTPTVSVPDPDAFAVSSRKKQRTSPSKREYDAVASRAASPPAKEDGSATAAPLILDASLHRSYSTFLALSDCLVAVPMQDSDALVAPLFLLLRSDDDAQNAPLSRRLFRACVALARGSGDAPSSSPWPGDVVDAIVLFIAEFFAAESLLDIYLVVSLLRQGCASSDTFARCADRSLRTSDASISALIRLALKHSVGASAALGTTPRHVGATVAHRETAARLLGELADLAEMFMAQSTTTSDASLSVLADVWAPDGVLDADIITLPVCAQQAAIRILLLILRHGGGDVDGEDRRVSAAVVGAARLLDPFLYKDAPRAAVYALLSAAIVRLKGGLPEAALECVVRAMAESDDVAGLAMQEGAAVLHLTIAQEPAKKEAAQTSMRPFRTTIIASMGALVAPPCARVC